MLLPGRMKMDFQDIQKLISEHIEMLPSKNVKIHEAEELAPKFLALSHNILTVKLSLDEQKIGFQTLIDVVEADCVNEAPGKTVTEKKMNAKAMKDYREAREALELSGARIDFLKANLKIFENAHIFYRQISKGD